MSLAHVYTVAFEGMEAREVDVQVHIGGRRQRQNPFNRRRPRRQGGGRKPRARARGAARHRPGAARYKRITVNLAPADLPKEGSHYDLPIALGLARGDGRAARRARWRDYTALGELSLDGAITAVAGVLPAAIAASAAGRGLICPAACGARSGLGGRSRDRRRAVADRAGQSHEGRAGADAARAETRRRRASACPI